MNSSNSTGSTDAERPDGGDGETAVEPDNDGDAQLVTGLPSLPGEESFWCNEKKLGMTAR